MIYKRLKQVRTAANVSQEELARYCGVSKQTVSLWESGSANPSIDHLKKICAYIHVGADYLLGIDESVFCFKGMHEDDFLTLLMIANRLQKTRETMNFEENKK